MSTVQVRSSLKPTGSGCAVKIYDQLTLYSLQVSQRDVMSFIGSILSKVDTTGH